jgi:hypothetical protein
MDHALVHFELFVRPHRRAPWTLALATEDRGAAFEAAEAACAEDGGAAVRLLKETRDPATGEFRPLVLVERGVRPEPRRRRLSPARPAPATLVQRPSCVQPQDLHGVQARQAIGRLLGAWLARNGVTPFELLHRADLAERLEACANELGAAMSNAALEQAGAPGPAMDQVRRGLEALAKRAIERIVRGDPDPGFQLGVAMAERLGRCDGWGEKTAVLLDLLDSAPGEGPAVQAMVKVLQQPLMDMLGAQGDLADIFGEDHEPGDRLLTLLQIAMAPQVAAIAAEHPALARMAKPLSWLPTRLALALHARPVLARTRWAMVRRVVEVLNVGAPLWPHDQAREIEGLRALAALLSRAGRLADPDDVAEALAGQWRRVARPEFVRARLAQCDDLTDRAETLLDLIDESVGRAPALVLGQQLSALAADRALHRELHLHGADAGPIIAALAGRARASRLAPELKAKIVRGLERLAARCADHRVAWV